MHAHQPAPHTMAKLVNDNLEIPTIPDVASRALKLMSDPDVSGAQLARTISEDQGLTAKVLKVANSALYALPREVKNLQQAAMVLGFTTLKSIVISASCRSIYKRFGMLERSLWAHSVLTAMAAHAVAQRLDIAHREEAFVAGLMHDVGKVVMNNGARDRYREVLRLTKEEELDSVDAERREFGFSHVDVGAVLVQRWELTPALEQAVFLHHDPELAESVAEEYKDLVFVTQLANRISHHLDVGTSHPAANEPLTEDETTQALCIDGPQLALMADEIRELYELDHASFS